MGPALKNRKDTITEGSYYDEEEEEEYEEEESTQKTPF